MRSITKLLINRGVWLCLLILPLGLLSGCADFFAEKPTEVQTDNILRDLSRIRVLPDPNVIEPQIYTEPPSIVQDKEDVKLFYFVRHHPVPDVAALVTQQYGFPVSQNPATNQVIVKCRTTADANAVMAFFEEIDVPPLQVRIDCIVSELFADTTMDWETTVLIQNLFGEDIFVGGKTDAAGNVLPAFPGASIRDQARSQIGLKVGVKRDDFLALVDMLVSKGYLKIMMSPSLEVVNGKTATIEATDKVPLQKQVSTQQLLPYNIIEYYDVIDSLSVTPRVFADGYIGMETKVVLGASSTPQGVKQTPIITKREIKNGENRIKQGESLVIGGIKKTEKRSVIRGVPFLKDIPLIGILFSSKDFEDRAAEVIFILTPTISAGGIPQAAMAQNLARRHEVPAYKETWTESILDPFGLRAKEETRLRAAELAEDERVEAERAKIRAERAEAEARELKLAAEQAGIEKEKAEQLKAQAQAAEAEAQKARALADKTQADAQKAAAEAEKAKKDAEAAQAQSVAAEAQKAATEAAQRKAEAEKAAAEAQKIAAQSHESAAKSAAEKAKADAEAAKAVAQAEEAKAAAARAEAEKASKEAEKARAEAERITVEAGLMKRGIAPTEPNAPSSVEPAPAAVPEANEPAPAVPAEPVQPTPTEQPSQPAPSEPVPPSNTDANTVQ